MQSRQLTSQGQRLKDIWCNPEVLFGNECYVHNAINLLFLTLRSFTPPILLTLTGKIHSIATELFVSRVRSAGARRAKEDTSHRTNDHVVSTEIGLVAVLLALGFLRALTFSLSKRSRSSVAVSGGYLT